MTTKHSAPDTSADRRWLAELNLLVVAIIWGVNMPIMKFALGRIDEYMFNALRLTLSALVLGMCVALQNRTGNPEQDSETKAAPIAVKYWQNVGLFAFLTGFAYQVCFLLGINATSAGNTALIMSAIPMWTAILAFFILSERLSGLAWAGMTIALAGVVIVTLAKSGNSAASTGSLAGNLLVSLAAFSWAIGTVFSRPMLRYITPIKLAFYSVALSVPLHFLVAAHAFSDIQKIFTDPWLAAALIYSGSCSTGLAYAMWNFGVKHLGVSHAAGYQNLVPLVALLASWVLISEQPFPMQIAGGVLIIAGLFVMRKKQRKPT